MTKGKQMKSMAITFDVEDGEEIRVIPHAEGGNVSVFVGSPHQAHICGTPASLRAFFSDALLAVDAACPRDVPLEVPFPEMVG